MATNTAPAMESRAALPLWVRVLLGLVFIIAGVIVLGVLYIVGGIVLVSQPVAGSLILTYVLGVVLFASGCVRLYVGIRYWAEAGWLIFLSGIFGILAGLVILI